MKVHTEKFKNSIKQFGKQIDCKISYYVGSKKIELGAEKLNSITPTYKGDILKTVMKELYIDCVEQIPVGTIVNCKFGVLVDNEYEYINFGDYIVQTIEEQKDTKSFRISCYDNMLRTMIDYHSLQTGSFPMTIHEYITCLCNDVGLEFSNKASTFANFDKIIDSDLYKDLGYTYRTVLDEIAQVTGSTICINNNNELEIRYINDNYKTELLSGYPIEINDAGEYKLQNNVIYGNSEQETRKGYNLIDLVPIKESLVTNQSGYSLSEFIYDSELNKTVFHGKRTKTSGGYPQIAFSLPTARFNPTGKNLAIVYRYKTSANVSGWVGFSGRNHWEIVGFNSTNEVKDRNVKASTKWAVGSMRISKNNPEYTNYNESYRRMSICLASSAIDCEIYVSDIMVVEITDDEYNAATYIPPEFEQYGAMPSPDYPSDIKNVGIVNLFDKEIMTELIGQFRSYANGSIQTSANWLGIKVPVKQNMTYTFTCDLTDRTKYASMCFFNSNMTFISGIAFNSGGNTFTTPTNCAYMTLAIDKNYEWAQLEEGIIAHDYVPYGNWIVQKTNGKNLFNENIEPEKFSYNASGNKVSDSDLCINQILDDITFDSIYVSFSSIVGNGYIRICEYNSDGVFIKRTLINNNTQLELNNNTKKIIFSVNKSDVKYFEELMIKKGSTATDYEPYKENKILVSMNKENLFDKDNANILKAFFSSASGGISTQDNNSRTLYIECKPNTTYSISKISSKRFRVAYTDVKPALSSSLLYAIDLGEQTKCSIKTNENAKYLCVYYYNTGADTLTEQQILDSIKIYESTEPFPYYELNKIGNVFDERDVKNGIFNKRIGKVVFDGSETGWTYQSSNKRAYISLNDCINTNYNNDNLISSHFIPKTNNFVSGNLVQYGKTFYFYIENIATTIAEWKTWLSNHPVTMYYVLDEPQRIQLEGKDLSLFTGYNLISLDSKVEPSNMIIENVIGYETIDEEYLKDINVNFGEKYGPVNSIVLSRAGESDNVYIQDERSVEKNGLCEIKIIDNQIMNFDNRSEYLPDIFNKLNGLEYYINDYTSPGICYLDLCDRYNVKIDDNKYSCVMFNDEVEINQGLNENIFTDMPKATETDYKIADKTDIKINRTSLIVDKQNGVIEGVVEKVDGQNQKIADIKLTVDELNSKISDIADVTTSGKTDEALLTLERINQSEPILINVKPINNSISYLYPRNNLYPSDSLYLKNRAIRFRNLTTGEIVDYELPNDLLYFDRETFDEFNLSYENQTCMVIKRCGYDANGNVIKLDKEQVFEYEYPTIALTDGDYEISLLGYNIGYIAATLMASNIYTTQFATKVEVASEIRQTAQEIDLNVNKKLTNYSTTTEMNSAITLKANEISSQVSERYSTKDAEQLLSSRITQNANSITSEVNRATNNENQLSSRITQTADNISSEVTRATNSENQLSSRITQSAHSIDLNVGVSSGKSTGMSISLIDANGNVISNGQGTITLSGDVIVKSNLTDGTTTISGNNITTGTIDASNVNVTNINANNITAGTISASKVTGGTLSGSAININNKFKVNSSGYMTSTSGKIGCWGINDNGIESGFGNNNVQLLAENLRYVGSTATYSTTWLNVIRAGQSASDKRLKNNIKELNEKYENFYNDLKPVEYHYNKDVGAGDKLRLGFIAQDVIQAKEDNNIEDIEMIWEENGYYNLDKQELIALNVWQIQKLKKIVEEQQKQIDELKSMIKKEN